MIPGVVTDLTAKLNHSLYGGLTSLNILSQHKESNMNIIFLNCVKKCFCIFSRSIIKSQGNHRTLLSRVVGTILIEVIIFHAFLNPSGLHISILIKTVCSSVNLRKTIDIICTVRILIPFSCGILMPSRCHNRKLICSRCALYRHHRSICAAVIRTAVSG